MRLLEFISYKLLTFNQNAQIDAACHSLRQRYNLPCFTNHIPPLVENVTLNKDIERAVMYGNRGVHVLCLPQGAGKHCSILKTCRQLQKQERISGVLPIVATQFGFDPQVSLTSWLMKNIGVTSSLPINPLSYYLKDQSLVSKPLVVYIEDVDQLKTHASFESFVVSLAEDSVLHRKYVVLLSTSDHKVTNRILNLNGRSKIYSVCTAESIMQYRWKEQQMNRLISRLHLSHEQLVFLYSMQQGISLLSTPGCIIDLINSNTFNELNFQSTLQSLNQSWIEIDNAHKVFQTFEQ